MSHTASPTYHVFAFTNRGPIPTEVKKTTNFESAKGTANFWDERCDVALYKNVDGAFTLLFGREHPELVNETENRWAVVARDGQGQVVLTVQDATGGTKFPKDAAKKLFAEKQEQLHGDLYRFEVILTD